MAANQTLVYSMKFTVKINANWRYPNVTPQPLADATPFEIAFKYKRPIQSQVSKVVTLANQRLQSPPHTQGARHQKKCQLRRTLV